MWAGQSFATLTFNAPFKAGGEYIFYANFISGKIIVAQQIVDPKIEPQFL
jgi:hypothetical protein